MRSIRRRAARAAAFAGVLFIGVTGIAYATGSLGGGTITGCRNNNNGQLRVVSTASECNSSEGIISWNAQGTTGPQGPSGPQGQKGDKGDRGDRGPAGADATATIASLVGSPCVTHSGQAGTIAIHTTDADDLVLHCTATASSSGGGGSTGETAAHLVSLNFARIDNSYYSVTVVLSQAVGQETVVQLASSNPGSVVVPAAVTVPAGHTTASSTFVVILSPIGAEITATLGAESIHAMLTPS
jgi:hypothetical protein